MIKLTKNTFYHELLTKVKLIFFILTSKQLSFNKKCLQFENEFSKWQKRKYSTFVNSGSSANLALIQSLLNLGWLKRGDKVGFSALGWSTTIMPLIQLGLVPVPIDIELDNLNISSSKIPTSIKALFITNLLGMCGDMDKISQKCQKNNILLLEDNCEALGTVYKKTRLGNFGLASTFSFFVGHHLSTIEGGMVCTNNQELSQMLKMVRAHGWDRNLTNGEQKQMRSKYGVLNSFYDKYTFYTLGYNLRPTEIQGYLGLIGLKYLNEIVSSRERNYNFIFGKNKDYNTLSSFAFPIVCHNQKERDVLIEKCQNKIEIRPIVGGDLTKQPFYKGIFNKTPNALTAHKYGLYIGNNPELNKKELLIIKKILFS